MREYRLPEGDAAADPVEATGLGLLRDPSVKVLRRGGELLTMSPEIRAFLARPKALISTKANVKSRVHRRVHLDYIGVKLFSAEGRLQGELRIIGLFTANAYTSSLNEVPYLRHKVAKLTTRAGFDPASYAGRALLNVLENYPRDELFQIDEETLYRFAIEIMNLSERPRIRALAHRGVPRPRLQGPHVGGLSELPRGAARPHPLHHRPRRGRDAADPTGGARGRHCRDRAHLGRHAGGSAGRDDRRLAGAGTRGALRRRLLGRLSRSLRGRAIDRRHRDPRAPLGRAPAGRQPLPP